MRVARSTGLENLTIASQMARRGRRTPESSNRGLERVRTAARFQSNGGEGRFARSGFFSPGQTTAGSNRILKRGALEKAEGNGELFLVVVAPVFRVRLVRAARPRARHISDRGGGVRTRASPPPCRSSTRSWPEARRCSPSTRATAGTSRRSPPRCARAPPRALAGRPRANGARKRCPRDASGARAPPRARTTRSAPGRRTSLAPASRRVPHARAFPPPSLSC
jgi:hypothetical protein